MRKYMNVREAAKALGVSEETVRRYLRGDGGKPPVINGVKLPLEWRIPESEIERLLSDGVPKVGRPRNEEE